MSLDLAIQNYVEDLSRKGLLRTRTLNAHNDNWIRFDSNDYLSLKANNSISEGYQEGYRLYPSGSGGSMLLSGYHETHHQVEQAFANWLDVDECILFSSGYAANLALSQLLGQLKAVCLIDKGVHASIYDGLQIGQVVFKRFQHNDLPHLQEMLNSFSIDAIITEGLFGMSGTQAPLNQIAHLCRQRNAELFVDEAHSFGVVGPQGRGSVAAYELSQNEVPLRIIAFGKAYAAQGALIAGKKNWIAALLQAGRSLIYSTAISPALSFGLLNTLSVIKAADERRARLHELIAQFKEHALQSPFQWSDSNTPIQQLQLGCPHLALYYAQELKRNGICCSAIRPPTVSQKATGLRIILNYDHTPEQLTYLFHQLSLCYESTNK